MYPVVEVMLGGMIAWRCRNITLALVGAAAVTATLRAF
jgi:hypothetical protein